MAEDIKVKFSADTSELGKAQGVISKLGGALRLLAFGAVAREALQLADEVDKLSKRFNISTDAVQELQYASKQTGVEFNQVASAMAIASRRVNEATAGIGDANKSLSALNLNAKELNSLSPDKQFGKIADALNNVSDQGTRGRLAFELFGRSASELNPLLKEGSTGLSDLATQAKNTGQIMSKETVVALDKTGDRLGAVKTQVVNLAGKIIADLSPAILEVADSFSALLKVIEKIWKQLGSPIVSGIGKGLSAIKNSVAMTSAMAINWATGSQVDTKDILAVGNSNLDNILAGKPIEGEATGKGSAATTKKKDPTKAMSSEEFDEEIAAIETQNADRIDRYQSNLDDIYALMEENGIKRANLTKEQEKLLTETEARARQERLQNLTDSLNYIATLSTSHNKTMARIGQASSIAVATMDTYAAATKALNSALPPFNYVLAAGVVAAGLSNVSKIAGVKGFATGGIAEANQPFIAGERGAEIVAPVNQASRVFNALETNAMMRRAEANVANSGGQPIININASGDMAGFVKSLRFEIEDANRMNI
jgi:hypothetical protein